MPDVDVVDDSGSTDEVDESKLVPLDQSPGVVEDDPDQDPAEPVPVPPEGALDEFPAEPDMVPGVDPDPTVDITPAGAPAIPVVG